MVIDRLTEKSVLSAGEEVYLGALTDLLERYEDAHVVIPPRTGVDALRFLMEENGLKQADLAAVLGRRCLHCSTTASVSPVALSAQESIPVDGETRSSAAHREIGGIGV